MQLEYKGERVYGCEGEKSDSIPSIVVSAVNEDSEALGIGRLVLFGSSLRSCRKPRAVADLVQAPLGVVLDEHCSETILSGRTASVMRQGRVFVCLESPVKKPGEQAYVKSGGLLGGKESAKDTPLNGAIFCSPGNKGDVIEMEINLMGGAA